MGVQDLRVRPSTGAHNGHDQCKPVRRTRRRRRPPGRHADRVTAYRFDEFELDPPRQELRRAGTHVPLEPQVFAVLEYLVQHRDRVVEKNELLDAVWNTRFVTESAL